MASRLVRLDASLLDFLAYYEVPTLVVAYVAITSTTPSATRQWVRAVVVLASLFAALHTIVMDAVLFGILF